MRWIWIFVALLTLGCDSAETIQAARDCRNAGEECGAGFVCLENTDGDFECALDTPASDADAATDAATDAGSDIADSADASIPPITETCAEDNGRCDQNAECSENENGVTCSCNAGFQGNGTQCFDVDECLDAVTNGGCDQNATCTNVFGDRECACKAGFLGDGEICTAVLCGANEYVRGNECAPCAQGTINAPDDDASGPDTSCEPTLCAENEYVNTNICTPCIPGTTNASGDDASGPNTTCSATRCGHNEYVVANVCTPCLPGATNPAGNDASGPDTLCTTSMCAQNEHVVANVCTACAAGTTNAADDDASGADTACTATLCVVDEYVSTNACTACTAGTTNLAGDDASGADTACTATLCVVDEYVSTNACTACAAGTTNLAGDDASDADTVCDTTLCAADEYVSGNVCVACAAGKTNEAGDDASGADTTCACATGFGGLNCIECLFEDNLTPAENQAALMALFQNPACTTISFEQVNQQSIVTHALTISRDVTIKGSGVLLRQIESVDADGSISSGSVLTISGGVVTLNDISLSSGNSDRGGGINVSAGSLVGNRITITDNEASLAGGGIYAATGTAVSLTDARITGNKVYRVDAEVKGGGIYVASGASFSMSSTVIDDNLLLSLQISAVEPWMGLAAGAWGAGIYSEGAVTITNGSVIEQNIAQAPGYGGGIAAFGGTLEMTGSSLTSNLVVGYTLIDGRFSQVIVGPSAIAAQGAELTLDRTTIELHATGNSVIDLAGNDTSFIVRNSTVSSNFPVRSTYMCGSVFNGDRANLTVEKTTFTNNRGSIFYLSEGTTNITDSTFSESDTSCPVIHNRTGTSNATSTVNVSQSTFAKNGQVVVNDCVTGSARSYVNMTNTTLVDNTPSECLLETNSGTGSCATAIELSNVTIVNNSNHALCPLRGISSSQGAITVRSSILMGNGSTCSRSANQSNGGTFTSEGGNVIDSPGQCTFDESDITVAADTAIASIVAETLAINDGLTETLSLPAGSAAIDAGGACVDHNGDAITTDQRGEARDATCDAGAYEVQVP